jgi:hypothetical protein
VVEMVDLPELKFAVSVELNPKVIGPDGETTET